VIDLAQRPEYLFWAAQCMKAQLDPKMCAWITRIGDDLNIMGVVVYTHVTRTNCDMSVAASTPHFLSRRFLDVVFHYPFITLALPRVSALIEEGNQRSLALCSGLGFKREGTLRRMFGARDGILMGMIREECRWIGARNEQRHSATARAA
jgi:RimJ/RimL family protein N-acetyltransferase